VQVVGGPHLVLADAGDPDGVLGGVGVQVGDDLLRLEEAVVAGARERLEARDDLRPRIAAGCPKSAFSGLRLRDSRRTRRTTTEETGM